MGNIGNGIMNTYLFSIHPKWCEKIFNGEKTIEVRKTAPKPPFKVVVYCTKGNTKIYLGKDRIFHTNCAYDFETGELLENILMNGKVIGEFVCDSISNFDLDGLEFFQMKDHLLRLSNLTEVELKSYIGKGIGKALHITDLKVYDEPKALHHFFKPEESCCFYNKDLGRCDSGYDCKGCVYNDLRIKRPPQSYMRIEEDTI